MIVIKMMHQDDADSPVVDKLVKGFQNEFKDRLKPAQKAAGFKSVRQADAAKLPSVGVGRQIFFKVLFVSRSYVNIVNVVGLLLRRGLSNKHGLRVAHHGAGRVCRIPGRLEVSVFSWNHKLAKILSADSGDVEWLVVFLVLVRSKADALALSFVKRDE